jgi:hypothetical protein
VCLVIFVIKHYHGDHGGLRRSRIFEVYLR